MSKAAELAKMGEVLTNSQIGGRRNLITNGSMICSQRATSETGLGASSKYSTVDRFNHAFDGTAGRLTSSQVASGLNGFGNALKLDCTTADTSVAAGELFIIQQRIEGQDLQQLKKGTSDAEQVTLSFYAKVVGSSTDIVVELEDADNSRHVAKLFTLTTSWARYTYTFPADTTGTLDDDNASSLLVNFWLHAGSTYNSGTLATSWASKTEANRAVGADSFFSSTDNELFLTGVQLEVGSQATPFEHRSFGEELDLCQRYFQKSYSYGDAIANTDTSNGYHVYQIDDGNLQRNGFRFKKSMRAEPTIVIYNVATGATGSARSNAPANFSTSIFGIGENGCFVNYTPSSGEYIFFHHTADAEL